MNPTPSPAPHSPTEIAGSVITEPANPPPVLPAQPTPQPLPPLKPKSNLLLVLPLLIFLGLAAFFAYKYFSVKPPLTPPAEPTPTQNLSPTAQPTIAPDTSNWKIYTNSKLGFELKFPTTFSLYAGKDIEKIPGFIPVCDATALACFYYPESAFPKTDFTGAGISLNILREKNTETSCKTIVSPGFSALNQILINGASFTSWTSGGAATGHQNTDQTYRTFQANTCFEIVSRITTESRNVNSPAGTYAKLSPGDRNEISTLFESVINTFKFLDQSPDTTNWKTYTNKELGISIQYPADLAVVGDKDRQVYVPVSYTGHSIEMANAKEPLNTTKSIQINIENTTRYEIPQSEGKIITLTEDNLELFHLAGPETIIKTGVSGRYALKTQFITNGLNTVVSILDGKRVLKIIIDTKDESSIALHDQILSTFKFVK